VRERERERRISRSEGAPPQEGGGEEKKEEEGGDGVDGRMKGRLNGVDGVMPAINYWLLGNLLVLKVVWPARPKF
jgi:hypothetical protein